MQAWIRKGPLVLLLYINFVEVLWNRNWERFENLLCLGDQ